MREIVLGTERVGRYRPLMWRFLIATLAVAALLAPGPGSTAAPKQLLAFVRGGDVFTISSDGTGARRLIRGAYAPSWSPDGRSIAFVSRRSGDEEIYVARADGSRALRLTLLPGPDLSPAWSPDGKQLTWGRAGEIWTMSVYGSGKR